MNAAILFTLVQFTLGVAAFCCLSLSMERHARQAGAHFKHRRQRTWLRRAGWSLLLATLLVTVGTAGWGLGLVSLFGVLSAAAVLVVGMVSYCPSWLIHAATGNALIASLLLGFSLAS